MDRTRVSPTIDVAPPDAAACHNCGARLAGPYCSRCGQKDVPLDRSLRQIARDWLDEYGALDSRLVITLVTLFFRPGRLTIDYNEGRRVRYVPPLRLYMIASVLFFFALAFAPGVVELNVATPDEDAAARAETPPAASGDSTAQGFGAWVEAQAMRAASDPSGFAHFLVRVLGWSMFVLGFAYTFAQTLVMTASAFIALGLF